MMFRDWLTPRRRNFILVQGIYVILVAIVIMIGQSVSPAIERVQGEEPSFTIALDDSNAPSSLSTETFGNGCATVRYVDFDYTSAKQASGYHVVLNEGGTISNNINTRITSLTSITATFSGGEATLTVGWQSMPSTHSQVLTSAVTVVLSDHPYYIAFTNTGTSDLSLASLVMTYSCVPAEFVPGESIQFGTYPQSQVTDSGLIALLNAASGTLPIPEDYSYWTEYNYYSDGEVSSYMWYIDLYYESNEYRGVYFTSYRPFYAFLPSSADNSFQDDQGYFTNEIYWFHFEPISWRVLDVVNQRAFLRADLILDSQDYQIFPAGGPAEGSPIHANNYQYSHIHWWLSYFFLLTAFTLEGNSRIQTTNVDNSPASTGYIPNPNACENTTDKIFLLSYAEATSAAYGFNTEASRQLKTTAYAQSQGACVYSSDGLSDWWLRSPNGSNEAMGDYVTFSGNFYHNFVDSTSGGVVPAMWISI